MTITIAVKISKISRKRPLTIPMMVRVGSSGLAVISLVTKVLLKSAEYKNN